MLIKIIVALVLLGLVWRVFLWSAKQVGGIWGIEDPNLGASIGTLLIVVSMFLLYRFGVQSFLLFATVLVFIYFLLKHTAYRSLTRVPEEGHLASSMTARKPLDPVLVFYMFALVVAAFGLYNPIHSAVRSDIVAYVLCGLLISLVWLPIIWAYVSNEAMRKALTITAYLSFLLAIVYQVYLLSV